MAGKPIKSDIDKTPKKTVFNEKTKEIIKQNSKKVINKFKTLTNYDAVMATLAIQKQNWKENWQKTKEQNQLVDGIAKYEKKENKLAKKIAKMTEKYNEQYKDSEAALTITAKAKRFVKDFKLNIQKTRLDMTNIKKESITNYKQTLQEKIEQINKKPLEKILEENKEIIEDNKPNYEEIIKQLEQENQKLQQQIDRRNQAFADVDEKLANGDIKGAEKRLHNFRKFYGELIRKNKNLPKQNELEQNELNQEKTLETSVVSIDDYKVQKAKELTENIEQTEQINKYAVPAK